MHTSHLRTAGLALAAVAVVSTGAASTALAAKAELVNRSGKALVKNKFKGVIGATVYETTGGARVKCSSGKASGTVTSTTTGVETATLEGCKDNLEDTCTTSGAEAGTIIIERNFTWLRGEEGKPNYLSMEEKTRVECRSIKGELTGKALEPIPSLEKFSTAFTFTAKQKKGVQEPVEYENSKKEIVKATLEARLSASEILEQAGVEGNEELVFEEEAEFI